MSTKKYRMVVILGLMVICYMVAKTTPDDANIMSVYCGAGFNGNVVDYAKTIAIYLCYSVAIYDVFYEYIHGYGIYQMIRETKRLVVLRQCYKKLLADIAIIEMIKLLGFTLFLLLLKRNIVFTDIKPLVFYFLGVLGFLMLQMVLEILTTSNLALLISNVVFVVNVSLGDAVNRHLGKHWLNGLISTSGMLQYRNEELVQFDHVFVGLYMSVVIVLVVASIISVKNKDFI